MIKHIVQLIALFSFISLFFYTGIYHYLAYAWVVAVPVIVLCLGYALYRTHAFYHIKKAFVLLLISVSLCALLPASTAWAQDLDAEIQRVGQEFHAIWRIPADQRTQEQQRQYDQLKKQFEDLLKQKEKESDDEKLCKSPHELLQEVQDDCWSCDMSYLIIEGMDKVATTFYNEVQENGYALKILALGFAFWLMFKILKMLSTWGFTDLGQVWTDIFQKFLLVIVAAALLISPIRQVFDLILTPIFSFSAGYSMKMSDVAAFGSSTPKIDERLSESLNVTPNRCSYCTAMLNPETQVPAPENIDRVTAFRLANAQDRAFSPQLKNSMLCIICSLYRTVSPPMIIGQALTCYSKTDGAHTFPPKWVIGAPFRMSIPDLTMWITGNVIVFTFFVITVLFPFYLIDAFFRIGFVATLMPFLIVAFVFKPTRKYADNAFKMVLYSLFTFLSLSLILVVLVQMFYATLADDTEAITTALAQNNIVKLFDVFKFASGGLLILMCLVIAWFAFKLISSIDEMTGEISGINLESTGGMQAVVTAAGVVATPVALTSAVYDETWGKTGSERAQIMGHGLPTYHSDEAKSRLIRRNTRQKFNSAADKVEHSTDQVADLAEQGVDQTGKTVEQGIRASGDGLANSVNAAGNALTAKLSAFTAATGGIGGIIAVPLIGLVKATQYTTWAGIKGTTIAAAWATRVATYVMKKVTKAAIKLPTKLTAAAIRKTGKMIAENKYFTKTAGATNSIVLGAVVGTVLGAAHVGLGLGALIPGASLAGSLSSSSEGRELASKEDELRVKRAKLAELRDQRIAVEMKRNSLLNKVTLSASDQAELDSLDSRLSQLNSEIAQFDADVTRLTQEVAVLKEVLNKKEQQRQREQEERRQSREEENKKTPGKDEPKETTQGQPEESKEPPKEEPSSPKEETPPPSDK